MQAIKSIRFGIESTKELSELIDQLVILVNWCIQKCIENNITSRAALHKVAYQDFKNEFDLASHYFHSAGMIATQVLRSWRKLCRKHKASWDKPPVFTKRHIRLEGCLTKFDGESIRLTIRAGEYLWIPLKIFDYQKEQIELLKQGKASIGEITISDDHVLIPFKHEIELNEPRAIAGIDMNEESADIAILNNEGAKSISVSTKELKTIKGTYYRKRRKIQKLKKEHPKTAKQLMYKYSKREKNRVKQKMHEISKLIVTLLASMQAIIVMEDLTNIRDSIRYGRKMNRRLHSWNFRGLQSFISYKGAFAHAISVYENPKDTSKKCPICGTLNNPNGRVYHCKTCGLEADRQMVGAWNIAIRCGESPLPPKGIYELKPDFREMQIFDINECISKI